MNLKKIPGKIILQQLDQMVQNERRQMHTILLHLNEVDDRNLYREVGCKSLFEFLNKHLGYSESSSMERMNAARLLRKAPEISEKLQSGDVNMSQLAKIESGLRNQEKQRRLDRQNVKTESDADMKLGIFSSTKDLPKIDQSFFILDLVDQVQNKTMLETQSILAEELDLPMKKNQKKTPQKDKSVRVEFTFTEEQFETFKRARDLISHVVKNNDMAEIVAYLATVLIKKKLGKDHFQDKNTTQSLTETEVSLCSSKVNTPTAETANVETAKVKLVKTKSVKSPQDQVAKSPSQNRQGISLKIRREKLEKSNYQCEHVDPHTQSRCDSTFQLQLDHEIPWALSKNDHPSNLRVLCAYHNLLEAEKWGLRPS